MPIKFCGRPGPPQRPLAAKILCHELESHAIWLPAKFQLSTSIGSGVITGVPSKFGASWPTTAPRSGQNVVSKISPTPMPSGCLQNFNFLAQMVPELSRVPHHTLVAPWPTTPPPSGQNCVSRIRIPWRLAACQISTV